MNCPPLYNEERGGYCKALVLHLIFVTLHNHERNTGNFTGLL